MAHLFSSKGAKTFFTKDGSLQGGQECDGKKSLSVEGWIDYIHLKDSGVSEPLIAPQVQKKKKNIDRKFHERCGGGISLAQ